MERNRRPPCVEEALSSMLWTPYDRTPSVSSEEESSTPLKSARIQKKINLPKPKHTIREKHLYPEPIRYSFPSYAPFVPKTINSQSAHELPSYENIEKERQHHSLSAIASSSSIYFIPPFETAMVNSFTDDFLQYQVRASPTIYNDGLDHQAMASTTSACTTNRFSNDFSSLNLNFPVRAAQQQHQQSHQHHYHNQHQHQLNQEIIQQQQQQQHHQQQEQKLPTTTNHINYGDLHLPKQTQHVDDDTTDDGTAKTQKTVADLFDEFKVSKPHKRQSQQIQRSSLSSGCKSEAEGDNNNNNNSTPSTNKYYVELGSCVQPANANGVLHSCHATAGVLKSNVTIVESRCAGSVSVEGAMRFNVPAAAIVAAGAAASSAGSLDLDNGQSLTVSTTDNTRTNTTFLGAAPQGSLTIHVNQSDLRSGEKHQDVVNHPSGVSIVNCYRAVPVQIVNSASDGGGGAVVQIVNKSNEKCDNQLLVQPMVDAISELPEQPNQADCRNNNQLRTFTSTEAQTDNLQEPGTDALGNDTGPQSLVQSQSTQQQQQQTPSHTETQILREQRRRDRRERRIARNARQQHIHPAAPPLRPPFEILPDILHSHVPPPYTTLPMTSPAPPVPQPVLVPSIITPLPVGPPPDDSRYTFPLPIMRRSPSERSGKGCCGQWFAGPPLRAVIAVVALGGVACALGGAALGATGLAGPPTSHLTAALLMIGVGVILVTVSGAAWRMTAPGTPQCLGLGSSGDLGRCGRRPCSGRAPHGLLYPEFQHRPPPPSYQASMQEYRLRLLLLDRDRQAGVIRGASPPPTYRSNAGSLLRAPLSARCTSANGGPGSEYSLPPSYRAQQNNNTIRTLTSSSTDDSLNNANSNTNDSACISTETAIISSEQQHHHQLQLQQQQQQQQQEQHQRLHHQNEEQHQLQNPIKEDSSIDIVSVPNALVDVNNSKFSQIGSEIDSKKIGPLRPPSNCNNDNNSRKDLVTIVTISGCTDTESSTGEMDILAHL